MNDQEYYYTHIKVSQFKLSMFQPAFELSDNFRYVIDNLPTGIYNDVIEEYIQTWILEYFGYFYITGILLGKYTFLLSNFFFTIDVFLFEKKMVLLNKPYPSIKIMLKISYLQVKV